MADAFGAPTVGKADDEQAGVVCGLEHTVFAGTNENRFGDDSDHLLHEHRGARQESARVSSLDGGIRFGTEKPERRSERLGEPSGYLDGGPVVVGPSEWCHERPGGPLSIPDEHGDVTRRVLEDDGEILVGIAAQEEAGGRVEKRDVDVVLAGESYGVRAWLISGVGGYACRDASLREGVSAFRERGAGAGKLVVLV